MEEAVSPGQSRHLSYLSDVCPSPSCPETGPSGGSRDKGCQTCGLSAHLPQHGQHRPHGTAHRDDGSGLLGVAGMPAGASGMGRGRPRARPRGVAVLPGRSPGAGSRGRGRTPVVHSAPGWGRQARLGWPWLQRSTQDCVLRVAQVRPPWHLRRTCPAAAWSSPGWGPAWG